MVLQVLPASVISTIIALVAYLRALAFRVKAEPVETCASAVRRSFYFEGECPQMANIYRFVGVFCAHDHANLPPTKAPAGRFGYL